MNIIFTFITIPLVLAQTTSTHKRIHFNRHDATANEDQAFWLNIAKDEISRSEKIFNELNTNKAKNVILFIGDGMSLPTLTASRIYKAQYLGRQTGTPVNGEESLLTFETFPHIGLSRTYAVDAQTPDSAATASAMFSGVKTNYYTLGFDNSIIFSDPKSETQANKVETLMTWAQNQGKDTGLVTTARVSHATPAALYAHSADRDWECDSALPDTATEENHDITWQLVNTDPGRRAKVVLGGGRSSFLPLDKSPFPSKWNYSQDTWNCRRKDQKNLIDQFLNKDKNKVPGFEGTQGVLVENRGDLMNLDVKNVDYVLGLFNWNHMSYQHQRDATNAGSSGEPSLADMTEMAIKMLQKNKNGFFLMIEGGLIDKGHHAGKANIAMHETMAMDLAVEKALELTDQADTLIVVTADHGHTMTMAGYQTRGSDIRGYVDRYIGPDGKPIHILSYANGPGFNDHLYAESSNVVRADLRRMNYLDFDFHQPSAAPETDETHSGSDVGIFATGPFAHYFHGVHQQNYIAFVIAYSSCLGPYASCKHMEKVNS